jgi:hypothetical protein
LKFLILCLFLTSFCPREQVDCSQEGEIAPYIQQQKADTLAPVTEINNLIDSELEVGI